MDIFSTLANTISPLKGLQMFKSGIEKVLRQPVNHFEIIWTHKGEIFFRVYLPNQTIFEQYNDPNKGLLSFAIKNIVKAKLKKEQQLDYCKCEYVTITADPYLNVKEDYCINLEIGMTENGEKIKHETKNYKP